jgi:hypothetical protein
VSSGGGLYLQSACNATVERTTIAGNSAGYYGGGLFGRDRVQDLARGGGIYVDTDSILSVTNTTVSRNTALNRGGEPYTRVVHIIRAFSIGLRFQLVSCQQLTRCSCRLCRWDSCADSSKAKRRGLTHRWKHRGG